MRLEHHLVGGYVRYISPHIIIIIIIIIIITCLKIMFLQTFGKFHRNIPFPRFDESTSDEMISHDD